MSRFLRAVAVSSLLAGFAVGVGRTSAQDRDASIAVQGGPEPGVAVLRTEPAAAEDLPAPPTGDRALESFDPSRSSATVTTALGDPFGIAPRTRELESLLGADARAAESARTFGAVMGFVLGGLGIGATPVFFALDDGSGLLPILSILPVQLGTLSLATALVGAMSLSTEERRYVGWRHIHDAGPPDLSEIARHEGFIVADADRARDARIFSVAQGVASLATGLFTGIVGLSVTRAEVTQITLTALGAVELLIGALQLLSALDAGDVESRPAQYEARTGVRLTLNATGVSGSF